MASPSFRPASQDRIKLHPDIVLAGVLAMTALAGFIRKGRRRGARFRRIGSIREVVVGPCGGASVWARQVFHRDFEATAVAVEDTVRHDASRLLVGGGEAVHYQDGRIGK